MATPKQRPVSTWEKTMQKFRDQREAESQLPLIAERWYVEEKWPDYETHNEFSYSPDYHTGKSENASGYLDSEEEAQEFIDSHDPTDAGGVFTIKHQYLRTHTKVWNEWGWV